MSAKRRSGRAAQRAARKRPMVVYVVAAVLLVVVGLLLYNASGDSRTGAKQWTSAPAMTIDTGKRYVATVQTEKGDIVIELLPQAAPVTVNNFVFLARQGYYDEVTFHRVLPGFMAQAGDPTGTGSGGPGYFIPNETSAGLTFDNAGVVAMANSGVDRNGSQFFITYTPQPGLNGAYTIFGHVTSGLNVAQAITLRDPSTNPNAPLGDKIKTIRIDEQ